MDGRVLARRIQRPGVCFEVLLQRKAIKMEIEMEMLLLLIDCFCAYFCCCLLLILPALQGWTEVGSVYIYIATMFMTYDVPLYLVYL